MTENKLAQKSRFKSFFERLSGKLLSVFSLLEERNNFFQNLSLLIGSGTPLVEALRIVTKEIQSGRMKKAVDDIYVAVESGEKFWQSLADHPYIFTEYEIRMIKIAEETGTLEKSLGYLAAQLEKDYELRGKIKSALFYPIIVLSFALIIGMGVTWFVLPKLARAFASLRIALPAVTRVLIYVGDVVNQYGQYIFPGVIIGIFVLSLLIRLTRLKFVFLGGMELLPGIGEFLRQVRTARLALFTGTLLDSGVPIVDALDTLVSISEAPREKRFFIKLKERIEIGDSFEKSFEQIPKVGRIFPPVTQQMIFVAEKSGRLPEVFLYISNLYEKRVELGAKNLSQTLEPVLLVGIAGVVAFIAVAIILPIYSLLGGIQGGNPPPQQSSPPPQVVEEVASKASVTDISSEESLPPAVIEDIPAVSSSSGNEPEKTDIKMVKILPTPINHLNVRAGPGTFYNLLRQIPDEGSYEYTTIEDGWYRILSDDGVAGWIYGQYAEIIEN